MTKKSSSEGDPTKPRRIGKRRVETLLQLYRELEGEWRAAVTDVREKRDDIDFDEDSESIAQMLTMRLDQIVEQRRKVQVALRRLTDGTYGLCEDCGERIPAARIEANPAAVRCIQCQRLAERSGE